VPVEILRKAYELARLGPTSANGSPARFVFLTTPGAKALLEPVLAPGNADKTVAAPVTVIIAAARPFRFGDVRRGGAVHNIEYR
jgi:3-hydroxypropanoate dehydrogenase